MCSRLCAAFDTGGSSLVARPIAQSSMYCERSCAFDLHALASCTSLHLGTRMHCEIPVQIRGRANACKGPAPLWVLWPTRLANSSNPQQSTAIHSKSGFRTSYASESAWSVPRPLKFRELVGKTGEGTGQSNWKEFIFSLRTGPPLFFSAFLSSFSSFCSLLAFWFSLPTRHS